MANTTVAQQIQDSIGKRVSVDYECRDIGYGIESGVLDGVFPGPCDPWGKWTFEAKTNEPEVTALYYFFPDEVLGLEVL